MTSTARLVCVTVKLLLITSGCVPLPAQTPRFAYVGNTRSDTISAYNIDPETGALTPMSVESVAAGPFPISLATHPTGRFLYVASLDWHDGVPGYFGGSGNVSVFAIDANSGELTKVGEDLPANCAWQVVLDPTGRFAYVADACVDSVLAFSIDQDSGALTPIQSIGAGSFPRSIAVDPTGRYLYAANAFSNDVSLYSIEGGSGTLTQVSNSVPAGDLPRWVTVDPTGRFVYVANQASLDISAYSIDNGSGELTPLDQSPFTSLIMQANNSGYAELDGLIIDPTGRYLYAAVWCPSEPSVQVPAFGIDGGTGALAELAESPFVSGQGAIFATVDPTGQFVYVANELSHDVWGYRLDHDTGNLMRRLSVPTQNNPESIAIVARP